MWRPMPTRSSPTLPFDAAISVSPPAASVANASDTSGYTVSAASRAVSYASTTERIASASSTPCASSRRRTASTRCSVTERTRHAGSAVTEVRTRSIVSARISSPASDEARSAAARNAAVTALP